MDSSRKANLMGRAIVAVLLTIGFYGLALAIAFGLLFLVYAEVAYLERINVRLTIFALIGAGVILWAIFPRIDRFEPPGPRLTRQNSPRLFAEIEKTAAATGQAMPVEVYLVSDVNAFVAERGGAMGLGARRVMGIGLPLLHLLTVAELRAVLAHEFGHYYGGDTSLGPWIYKTRAAIIRTVMGAAQASRWLQIPFEAYAKLFMRVTNAISRQQEFSADQLAAQVAGAQSATSSLQKVHKYGFAFQKFFEDEYLPVVNAGYRVPLLSGFDLYVNSARMAGSINKFYEEQAAQEKADPYDTHPALKERLAALTNLPMRVATDERPALELMPNPEALESDLLIALAPDAARIKALKEIRWEQAAELAFLPQWEAIAKTYASALKGLTFKDMAEANPKSEEYFVRFCQVGKFLPEGVTPQQVPGMDKLRVLRSVFGGAMIVALRRAGWQVMTGPGDDVALVKGAYKVEPFQLYLDLMSEELAPDAWRKTATEFGIADLEIV